MAYEIFTADTIAGRFHVAVKVRKDALPGDNRSDAYQIVIANWGRGGRLLQETTTAKKLSAAFSADPTAPGWGAIARIPHA